MKYNVERHPGEYCANECRNRECPVNSKNKPKGEWNWTPKPFCGTSQCKGYIRPGSYEGGKGN